MKRTAEWVITIEDKASKLYEKASRLFTDDPELYDLLRDLSEDEKLHREIVKSAYELSRDKKIDPCPVTFDEITRHLESFIELCDQKLDKGMIKKPELIEAIVYLEFSETNELFLYILNSLKATPTEYAYAIEEVDKHRRSIERFLSARPEYAGFLKFVQRIPDVSKRKYLVVDDMKAMVEVLKAFFSKDGDVISAMNGQEALSKLTESYTAIITDIDMPVMDGIEFYKKAVEKYPRLKDRFLFLTGSFDETRLSFFKSNNLKYLNKPVPIREIKRAVSEITGR